MDAHARLVEGVIGIAGDVGPAFDDQDSLVELGRDPLRQCGAAQSSPDDHPVETHGVMSAREEEGLSRTSRLPASWSRRARRVALVVRSAHKTPKFSSNSGPWSMSLTGA